MRTLTMITRHGLTKDEIGLYTLISDDYQTVTMATANLIDAIKDKKIVVTNMAVTEKGLVSTNGALDKYTYINMNTNQVEGTPRAVILDRVEKNDKLVGYTIFTQYGQIREVNVADAAALASKNLISNGKIRHTQDGDIVSAIGGTYPLRTIDIDKAPAGKISVKVMYFSESVSNDCSAVAKYAGVVISCTSAVEMSKIMNKIGNNNKKVKALVNKINSGIGTSSLNTQRMGANSIYSIIDLDTLEEQIKLAVDSKATCDNNLLISVVDYTSTTPIESVLKMDKAGTISVLQKGPNGLNDNLKAAKDYAEEIKARFAGKLV